DELFALKSEITIDLETQTIRTDSQTYDFEVDQERKRRLINGLDDIGLTLQYADEIKAFEVQYFKTYSWI
ncbi:3-isopropylmalate dehydratase small subunit, partial [Candidatus Thioglobus sp.]|nr:3-isopropylmalate dehydratase small subunit [Candidatus Thioglobus sp.]